jgi:hypothetical protein
MEKRINIKAIRENIYKKSCFACKNNKIEEGGDSYCTEGKEMFKDSGCSSWVNYYGMNHPSMILMQEDLSHGQVPNGQ